MDTALAIQGTATFQVKAQGGLIDSTGVTSGLLLEEFFFLAEYNDLVNIGLAVSNPFGENIVTVTIRVISSYGSLVDTYSFVLGSFEHQAFFLSEKLTIPLQFLGTVEVEATNRVSPLVLRVESNQLSSLQVDPMPGLYDFEIILSDGRVFRGEMTFRVGDHTIKGVVRWTSPSADPNAEYVPITGTGAEGAVMAFTITGTGAEGAVMAFTIYSKDSNARIVVLQALNDSRTTYSIISATLFWWSEFGNRLGTFTATKRLFSVTEAAIYHRSHN